MQLGRMTTSPDDNPPAAVNFGTMLPPATRAVSVTAGGEFTHVVLSNRVPAMGPVGNLLAFGHNQHGQLGVNLDDRELRPTPVEIDVSRIGISGPGISAGNEHACASTVGDNGVWCWGRGAAGRLGDGNTNTRKAPVEIATNLRPLEMLSLGSESSCALGVARVLNCWGEAGSYQLGNNSTMDRDEPVRVSGF
jgi:alpha-tubulin suppressor-like RCC1 family protein